jgi:hypothetical protein
MLVVFDIDGTLANIEHRLSHVRSKPKNWRAFDEGIPQDKLIKQVAEVFHSLSAARNTIVLVSGRNERSREATVRWLTDNNIHTWDKMYLRAADDFRSDDIVKREMLDSIVAEYGRKPDMVFEDRPRVVRMWRDNGIFVFNVYQGEEDF